MLLIECRYSLREGSGGTGTCTYPSIYVMDLSVAEWEINTLWLEPSLIDRSVHDANECHSIILVVHKKSIQKCILGHLLHGS
jgi:hypothetical protein